MDSATALSISSENSGSSTILYATLAKGPKLARDDQMRSTRLFMRELNRFGITSVIDAGSGFQNYPEDYDIIETLHERGELTVRLAYNLFTQKPAQELSDFQRWTQMTPPGAGEMLAFSAADFEDFFQPRSELPHVAVSSRSRSRVTGREQLRDLSCHCRLSNVCDHAALHALGGGMARRVSGIIRVP